MRKPLSSADRPAVQVISRAAQILRVLEKTPEGMSLGAIAKEVGLARSTVQRIVGALTQEQFLIPASPTAGVRLGPGLVMLGAAAKADIDTFARPYLAELARELDVTVDLSMYDGNVLIFIDQAHSGKVGLQVVSAVGQVFPIHCVAHGKAILAELDADELELALADGLERYTENTITSRAALNRELATVRREQVAYDREEHSPGICAAGVTIKDPFGRRLAMTIPVPSVRFYGQEAHFVEALRKYQGLIEAALGQVSP